MNVNIKSISNPPTFSTYVVRLPFWHSLAPRAFHILYLHTILYYCSEACVFQTSFQAAFEIPGWRSGMLASKNHLVSIVQSVLSSPPVLYIKLIHLLKLHCICKLFHHLVLA